MKKILRYCLVIGIYGLVFIGTAFSTDFTVSSDTWLSAGSYSYGVVTVNGGCTLLCKGNTTTNTGVVITCDTLIVNVGGTLSADSQGYPGNQGPGWPNGGASDGGSYGGYGDGSYGTVYGSIKNPQDIGSGGNLYGSGSYGGGLIALIVNNGLVVNGRISANGTAYTGNWNAGGSGGSINIRTKTISGSGEILANGGGQTGAGAIGNGGGGRIAIYYETNTFTGSIYAKRGNVSTSLEKGGCGTIYMMQKNQTNGDLIIDGGGVTGERYTPIPGSETFDTVYLKNMGHIDLASGRTITTSYLSSTGSANIVRPNGGTLLVGGTGIPNGNFTVENITLETNNGLTMNNLTIKSTGKINHKGHYSDTQTPNKVNITVNNDLTIDAGASIDVTGRGYPAGKGQGKPVLGWCGGSYGGKGGSDGGDSVNNVPGNTYGSETAPTDLGSGGNQASGGAGGGAIFLLVWGTLKVDGSIVSEGGGGGGIDYAGSGGSVYIKTPNFTGAGTGKVSVRGGAPTNGGRPGGGAGRMAIYYYTNTFQGTYDTAGGVLTPGAGGYPGTKYSVFTEFHLPPRQCSIDNPSYSSPIPGKRPSFKWTSPTDEENDKVYFDIQVSQDSSFTATPTVSASSDSSTAGFQYSADNGITWQSFPTEGVSSNAIPAIRVSYTCQSDLWVGDWYWRVRARDWEGNGNWSDTGYLPSIIGDLVVKINSPSDSIAVYVDRIKVEGAIEQSIGQTISVNGVSSNLDLTNNAFSTDVSLEIGKNEIVVTGNGVLANYVSDTVVVYRLRLPVSVLEEKVGADGGTVRLDDRDEDKENDTRIEIEPGTLDREVRVTLKTLDGDTPIYGNIPSYEILVDGKEHYRFKKKIRIVLSYRNLNAKETEEDKLKIFYWDGIKWQLVGGEVNKSKKIVTTYTNHVSRYAVMVLPASKEFMVSVSPQIFTPNGDGINDMVIFNCFSSIGGNLEIKIFTNEGKLVRQMTETMTGSGISIAWDGLDANNNLAETGIYLYNVIVSGKAASSGSMIIAK